MCSIEKTKFLEFLNLSELHKKPALTVSYETYILRREPRPRTDNFVALSFASNDDIRNAISSTQWMRGKFKEVLFEWSAINKFLTLEWQQEFRNDIEKHELKIKAGERTLKLLQDQLTLANDRYQGSSSDKIPLRIIWIYG